MWDVREDFKNTKYQLKAYPKRGVKDEVMYEVKFGLTRVVGFFTRHHALLFIKSDYELSKEYPYEF